MALALKTGEDTTDISDADLMADGDKGTIFTIRYLTVAKNRELVRHHTKPRPNPRSRAMEDVTDWEAVADAQFDYVLVNWKGVTLHGKDVPCDSEHKQLIDATRRAALLVKAGLNEVQAAAEVRAEAFPPLEAVR